MKSVFIIMQILCFIFLFEKVDAEDNKALSVYLSEMKKEKIDVVTIERNISRDTFGFI